MSSEKEYLRHKAYNAAHWDAVKAKHDEWIESHRNEWNAYQREYKARRRAGLPGGKRHWNEAEKGGAHDVKLDR